MGAIVRRLADVAVVTSDNPRSEDPARDHRRDHRAGVPGDADVEIDRRRGDPAAVGIAAPGDVVSSPARGTSRASSSADRTIPFDDREVAREALSALAGAA